VNARPPGRVTLLWCPVCGRDDRITDLKRGAGRHFAGGSKCPGEPRELEYVIPRVPEPLPALDAGSISAAVAVEVAIRPGLQHLGDGGLSFVGRTVQYRADTVEQVADLASLVLRDIAQGLPDAIAAHPRPEGGSFR
jgi:hypothetical protein